MDTLAQTSSAGSSTRDRRETAGFWRALRTTAAVVFALIAAVSLPAWAVASWMKGTVLDTDAFTQTLAPLATDAQFQAQIAEEVELRVDAAIEETAALGILDSVTSGLGALLNALPFEIGGTETLTEFPAEVTEKIGQLVASQTLSVLQSAEFPPLWDASVRQLHGQLVNVLDQSAPPAGNTAVLNLEVGPLVQLLQTSLQENGEWWAQFIPEIQSSIPIVELQDVDQLQQYYRVANGSSQLLLIVALVSSALALALAPRRLLILGVGALATFAVSAYVWYSIPGFADTHFNVTPEGPLGGLVTKFWSSLSAPLVEGVQQMAGVAIIVAVVALVLALIVYLRRPSKPAQAPSGL